MKNAVITVPSQGMEIIGLKENSRLTVRAERERCIIQVHKYAQYLQYFTILHQVLSVITHQTVL